MPCRAWGRTAQLPCYRPTGKAHASPQRLTQMARLQNRTQTFRQEKQLKVPKATPATSTLTVNSNCNTRIVQGTTCQQTPDLAGYAPYHKSSTALWPKRNITREDVHACAALGVKSPKHIQLTNNSAKWFSYKLLMSTKLM